MCATTPASSGACSRSAPRRRPTRRSRRSTRCTTAWASSDRARARPQSAAPPPPSASARGHSPGEARRGRAPRTAPGAARAPDDRPLRTCASPDACGPRAASAPRRLGATRRASAGAVRPSSSSTPARSSASASRDGVPSTSASYTFGTPYRGCASRWASSPSFVRSSAPVVSTSSRPTGTTRGSEGTSSTTVGRPCGSLAVVTTPAGLCSKTYVKGCRRDTRTVDLDDVASPHVRVQLARPTVHAHAAAADQLVCPPPRRDTGTREVGVQAHRRILGLVSRLVAQIETWTDKLADLAVFGANVQPGQLVAITSYVGKEEVTRKITRAAYQRGATLRRRPLLRPVGQARADRARGRRHARFRPAVDARAPALPLRRACRAHLAVRPARAACTRRARPGTRGSRPPPVPPRDRRGGEPDDDELEHRAGADPFLGRARLPRSSTARPPTSGCGRTSRTSAASRRTIRPPRGSSASADLKANAQRLTAQRFDALRLHGPGTDLTIGLLPSAHWAAGDLETVDGRRHSPNIPTEEVFTTPDPERVDGHVTATMPLELSGSIITGITVEFEGGRAVKIDADEGADALRAVAAADDGASRLGEIALVDGEGRIGPLDRVFYDTLIDENAATHIALGDAYDHPVEDPAEQARINKSTVHVDFMIGSLELDVDGIRADGQPVPVLRQRRLADLMRAARTTRRAPRRPRAGARGARRRPRRDRRAAAAPRGSRVRRHARRAASSCTGPRRRHRSPGRPR